MYVTAFNLFSSDLPAQLRPAATRCFVCCTRLLIQALGRCGRLFVSWLPLCLHIVPGASAALARHPVCRLRMLVADTKSDGRRLACGHRGLQQVRLQFSCMPVDCQREAGSSARHCRRCRVPTKRPPAGGRARSGRLPTSLTVGERCFGLLTHLNALQNRSAHVLASSTTSALVQTGQPPRPRICTLAVPVSLVIGPSTEALQQTWA